VKTHLKVSARYSDRLMAMPNVQGIGVGHKCVGECPTDDLAIIVLVEKKLPPEELRSPHLVPRSLGSGLLTDVVEVGRVRALPYNNIMARRQKQRPAPGGVSVGHYETTAGTLGVVVRDRATGKPLILSNNHVLANTSSGDDDRARLGDPVLQPGRYDGGRLDDDVIGFLDRYIPVHLTSPEASCPLARGAERAANRLLRGLLRNYQIKLLRSSRNGNLVDAAVARPIEREAVSMDILGIGEVKGTREASLGQLVQKSGRTSGVNSGEVRVVGASIKVSMGEMGDALFVDQIITTPMAEPGDSGALLLDQDGYALGLLSAGSDRISVASRIDNVLDSLDLTL